MKEKEKLKLYLPRGVKKGKDIIEGVGFREIKDILIVFTILAIPTSIIYLIRGDTKLIYLVGVLLAVFSVGICAKIGYISLYTMIKNIIKFYRSKKMYKYKGYRR